MYYVHIVQICTYVQYLYYVVLLITVLVGTFIVMYVCMYIRTYLFSVSILYAPIGLKTALVEKDDFSSGTSCKSTKLIHGGVRYLYKAVLGLDYEQVEQMCTVCSACTMLTYCVYHAYCMYCVYQVYST